MAETIASGGRRVHGSVIGRGTFRLVNCLYNVGDEHAMYELYLIKTFIALGVGPVHK